MASLEQSAERIGDCLESIAVSLHILADKSSSTVSGAPEFFGEDVWRAFQCFEPENLREDYRAPAGD